MAKTRGRGDRRATARPAAHPRRVRRPSPPASVEREVEIPLPSVLKKEGVPRRGSVALVEVEGERLKLRFLRPWLVGEEASTLTEPEGAALAKGGVEPVSDEEALLVDAQAAAAYQRLRATSLGVEEAARRLGVNASRVRQRLGERSLYGLKDGSTWLLPAFQFLADGLVPGVDVVVRRLPSDIGPLAVARWFSNPNSDLCTRDEEERPLTPLRWLLGGNPPERAAELAAAL